MTTNSAREKLERAYRGTSFEVDHPDGQFVIRIGEMSATLDAILQEKGETCWAYVTACNPRSAQLSSVANSERHSELRSYLLSLGFTIYPGKGVPSDPGWRPEASFLIVGITQDQAARIGVMLEQNAIVVGEVGRPAALMSCNLPETSKEGQLTGDDANTLALERYIERHIEKLWENAEVMGVWVREADVPNRVNPATADILEGKIPSQRLEALEDGEEPTAEELRLWREAWIERALEDEDADVVPGYAISKVVRPGSETMYALILATGYSFTHIERWVEGVFPSVEAAMNYISASGWHN